MDGVVLRDRLSTFVTGIRQGPYGLTASPNVTLNNRWMLAVRELFKQTKLATPDKLVYGYSQATSAVGEWRLGPREQIINSKKERKKERMQERKQDQSL